MQGHQRSSAFGSGVHRHLTETILPPLLLSKKHVSTSPVRLLFLVAVLILGAFASTRLLESTSIAGNTPQNSILPTEVTHIDPPKVPIKNYPPKKFEIPLNCSAYNLTGTCPVNYYSKGFHVQDDDLLQDHDLPSSSPPTCPEYFRWIHEDLRPWRKTGITRDMVERAKRTATFRLVILNGRAYVKSYTKAFQSRDTFTLWGILQLLRRYPGKLPDLDLMFDCVDWPVVAARLYRGPNAAAPPPLFRYCGTPSTLDIVFPDWSFWGWPEINIKPWESLLKELKEGNRRTKWMDREPFAYWKGNPNVAEIRVELLQCNVSEKQDWNARVYAQDWIQESQLGYKQSDLASQCTHRYKIYIEGSAWSVSDKYILACDSETLVVKPTYYDFYTRGLMPVHHYWPIRNDDKCRSIKFAVDWGNSHKGKAQEIGKAASNFILEELKMDFVYDYQFHVLNEYAKLFQYKPTVPPGATELCAESMACLAGGLEKKFMMESMVKGPSDTSPCTMPPPYDPLIRQSLERRKVTVERQVEVWEKQSRGES